jgi:hypothetical protein
MKRLFAIAMVVLVTFAVPVVPAFAGEQAIGQQPADFQALSSLPTARRTELAAMTDDQLAAVEGAADFCLVCINAARVSQTNVSVFSGFVRQSNGALVYQSIN